MPEFPGEVFKLPVTRMSGAADAQSRTVLVEIDIDNSDKRIYPGTYAEVRFNARRADAAVVVPTNTLLMRTEGPHVVLVKEATDGQGEKAGVLELRRVTLGRDMGRETEITSGLTGDETLVVNPSDNMTDGTEVEAREVPATPAK